MIIKTIENSLSKLKEKLDKTKNPSEVFLSYTKLHLLEIEDEIDKQIEVNTKKFQNIKKIIETITKANSVENKPLINLQNKTEYPASKSYKSLKTLAGKTLSNLLKLHLLKKKQQELFEVVQNKLNTLNFGSIWRGNSPFLTLEAWKNVKKEISSSILLSPKETIAIDKSSPLKKIANYGIQILIYLIFLYYLFNKSSYTQLSYYRNSYSLYFLTYLVFIGIIPYYLIEPLVMIIAFYLGIESYTHLTLFHSGIASLGFIVLSFSILLPGYRYIKSEYNIKLKVFPLLVLILCTSLILFINNIDLFNPLSLNPSILAPQVTAIISFLLFFVILIALIRVKLLLNQHRMAYEEK